MPALDRGTGKAYVSPVPPAPRSISEDMRYDLAYDEWVPFTNPAAGANLVYTVPGQYATRLVAITFRLVTDANAANRVVTVDIQDGGGNTYCSSGAAAVITASTTQDFFGDSDRTVAEWNTNTPIFFPLADTLVMPGKVVQITVANKQATDQLSRIFVVFERFPTGARGYNEGESGDVRRFRRR